MASAVKKVDKICQIVQLKQVMKRWKNMGIGRRSVISFSDSDSDTETITSRGTLGGTNRRIPSGYMAVYIGVERCRFVIPTRYLNLPVFVSLLKKSEEEFGFQSTGGLVIPCEVRFFKSLLRLLSKDEQKYGKMKFDDLLKMFGASGGYDPCRDGKDNASHGFTPLLKARV